MLVLALAKLAPWQAAPPAPHNLTLTMLKRSDVVPIRQTWSVRYSHGKCQAIAQHDANAVLYTWNNGLLIAGAHTSSETGYGTCQFYHSPSHSLCMPYWPTTSCCTYPCMHVCMCALMLHMGIQDGVIHHCALMQHHGEAWPVWK